MYGSVVICNLSAGIVWVLATQQDHSNGLDKKYVRLDISIHVYNLSQYYIILKSHFVLSIYNISIHVYLQCIYCRYF